MKPEPRTTVVVCDPNPEDQAVVRAFLVGRKLEAARWYAEGQVDDLAREVEAGRIDRVVFLDPQTALEGVWNEQTDLLGWISKYGVRIDCAVDSESAETGRLQTVVATWQVWRGRRKRQNAVAGILLSLIAVGAAFVLLNARF